MRKEDKVRLILQEIDKEYSIATYVEKRVERAIGKALQIIEDEEDGEKDDRSGYDHSVHIGDL